MSDYLNSLLDEIHSLEETVKVEIKAREKQLNFRIERGRIQFADDVLRVHRKLRQTSVKYVLDSRFLVIVTAPLIYGLILPAILLDIGMWFYQLICFPVYGIERVQRADYFLFDRHKLRYLNSIEKANCEYCAYFNGIIAYAREVASRTEQYWCPIRHARIRKGAHARYKSFVPYADPEAYKVRLEELRLEMAKRKLSDLES